MTEQVALDALEALIAGARKLPRQFQDAQFPDSAYDEDSALAELDAVGYVAVVASNRLADALESALAELRQERERAENGSCWDDGPQMRTPGGCDPMPPKCELRAGHLGAHRGGGGEWMRNPSSYRQVAQERDEARAALSRAEETIEKVRTTLGRAMSRKEWREDGWEVPAIEVQRALDAIEYNKQKEADRG